MKHSPPTTPAPKLLEIGVEAFNDELARNHPIDDYYECAPLPIRLIERRRLAIIREFVGERKGMRIAEVGSGGGHVLQMFRRSSLLAIDVSGEYLRSAQQTLTGYNVKFLKGEINKMERLPVGFDRVICTEVLEHTLEPEAILATIARMLAPSGKAIITVPNDPLIRRAKHLARGSVGRVWRGRMNWGGDEAHLHEWRPDEARRMISRHLPVVAYRASPWNHLPMRVCFLCGAKR